MNVYYAGWFRSPFVMWHMKHPTDDENALKCFWLVVKTLAMLHGVKLTRKDHLPGTSLQETGCVFVSYIAHPLLGPQSSDMCSYFEFYLNGNVRLIKIQDQWNVNILFDKINSLVLEWTFDYIKDVLWYLAGESSLLSKSILQGFPVVASYTLRPSTCIAFEGSLLTCVPMKS